MPISQNSVKIPRRSKLTTINNFQHRHLSLPLLSTVHRLRQTVDANAYDRRYPWPSSRPFPR